MMITAAISYGGMIRTGHVIYYIEMPTQEQGKSSSFPNKTDRRPRWRSSFKRTAYSQGAWTSRGTVSEQDINVGPNTLFLSLQYNIHSLASHSGFQITCVMVYDFTGLVSHLFSYTIQFIGRLSNPKFDYNSAPNEK